MGGQNNVSVEPSGDLQISYSGAQTGDNEYVSVLLCDNNDNILYYGNIAQNSASGTATLDIPSGLAVGNYTLKVFSEQCNGDYKTDYASAFQDIDLKVTLPQETTPDDSFEATGGSTGTDTGIISDSQKQQNSIWLNRKTSVKTTNKAMKVTWGKVSGADGYDIYVAVAGKKFGGITKSAGSNKKAVTIKKIDGKKLKAKKNYQVKVRAYRMINGQKEYIADGTTLYTVLNSNPKYTNAKKVRVDKKKYTLKKGKKVKIQASVVKQKGSKKLLPAKYGPQLSYMSSDSTVATVSKKGRITAKKKGKCTIYVRALNGTCKKVKVTVK